MISAPPEDLLLFNIEDCQRQIAAIRYNGERPLRIRVAEVEWKRMESAPSVAMMLTVKMDKPTERPTLLGLPVRVDREWRGPITVETLRDQKP